MNMLNDLEYRMSKEDLNAFDENCQSDFEEETDIDDNSHCGISDWSISW